MDPQTYQLLKASASVAYSQDPGKRTEVIGLIELERTLDGAASIYKHFLSLEDQNLGKAVAEELSRITAKRRTFVPDPEPKKSKAE